MNFEEYLKENELTVDQFNEKSAEDKLAVHKAFMDARQKAFDEAIESKVSKEDLQKLANERNKGLASNQKLLEDLILEIKAMKEQSFGGNIPSSETDEIKKAVRDNIENIQKAFRNKQEFTIVEKAVGTVTNASGTGTAPALFVTQETGVPPVNYRIPTLLDRVNIIPTSQAVLAYTEAEPKEGDLGWVEETGSKPQFDIKWTTRYAEPKKVAGWIRVTEEALQDIPFLEHTITETLRRRHELKRETAIINGTGSSGQPKGVLGYATSWAGSYTGISNSITCPKFMDVVWAMATKIYTTHNFNDEMPYIANTVLVTPQMFLSEFKTAKDNNGAYLYPMAQLFDAVVIDGMLIMPHHAMAAGNIFVGDLTRYNVSNYQPYTIKVSNNVADDFIKNQWVILAESRGHYFVKNFDEKAFMTGSYATILGDIDDGKGCCCCGGEDDTINA